jgi:hypothetical protein
MRQKKAITRELRDRYQKSSKKEKTIILNEFIQLTRYNRCYACQILKVKKEKLLGYALTRDIFFVIVRYNTSYNQY